MRRLLPFLLRLVLTLALLLVAVWGAMALIWRLEAGSAWALATTAVLVLLIGWGVVDLWRGRRRGPVAAGAALVALLGWWQTLKPSHERDWITELERLPTVRIEGERLTVENVRNFRWLSETDAETRWETRSFDLGALEGADLTLSYWSGEFIAHMIVSFVFRDAAPLAISIEVRRQKGEPWSALAGFFKQYELAYVAADERDLIGLRTHHRGEDVRVYRLRATPAQARDVLLSYAADMNALAAEPRWYDTLTTNCTTVAFGLARRFADAWGVPLPLDPRLLLSGLLPGYLQKVGALRADMALAELTMRARVSERAKAIPLDDPAFSAKLREGLPGRE